RGDRAIHPARRRTIGSHGGPGMTFRQAGTAALALLVLGALGGPGDAAPPSPPHLLQPYDVLTVAVSAARPRPVRAIGGPPTVREAIASLVPDLSDTLPKCHVWVERRDADEPRKDHPSFPVDWKGITEGRLETNHRLAEGDRIRIHWEEPRIGSERGLAKASS